MLGLLVQRGNIYKHIHLNDVYMTDKLDKKDWKLLYYLCQDARLSHNKIAKLIRTSKNSATYRIRRLLDRKVISGFFTIVDTGILGSVLYTTLIRLNATKEKEDEFVDYLKANNSVTIIDGLVGKWNFLVEFACRDPYKFFGFLTELQTKFSDIIDAYEAHPILDVYNVEQLPVELVEERSAVLPIQNRPNRIELDETERKLLSELNKNSTASLIELGSKVGLNYKTVSSKIKKLKDEGVITKFTSSISLEALGYDVYLILVDFKNISTQNSNTLKSYIKRQKNIRAAFISSARPLLFIYLAVKKAAELQNFLLDLNSKFASIIINQEYFLTSTQPKYDLFPDGVLQ